MNLPRHVYTICYILSGLFFLVPEILALIDKDPGDTLTEHLRPLIQGSSFLWFMAGGFLIWLLWHFLLEGRR